ncbi:MAG TPA: galactokinase [Longimicrobiales bacterium]|nr:galactokinase [Longimicrobiales bacterium]
MTGEGPFLSFAPGRVNLIGEHIDYHALPVLPMALERGVRIRFTPREDERILLENADTSFPARDFRMVPGLEPGPLGDWGNYARAAAVTALETFHCRRGIEGQVTSDLPPAAGLSSSSALMVAMCQALLHADRREVPPLVLAEAAAEGERFVGTAGGGMDQAASLLGRAGHALRIEFAPLAAEPVPIPGDWRVVVAHTGVRAEKSGGAQEAYNARRSETTTGLARIAADVGRPGASPRELLARVATDELLAAAAGLEEPVASWVRHILNEAVRVEQATEALRGGELLAFGRLLNASHDSLRDLYEVSHPRLDALVEAALAAGAAGARLTGAGFGGCMLAVCDAAAVDEVRSRLAARQAAFDPAPELAPFVAVPGPGASVRPA